MARFGDRSSWNHHNRWWPVSQLVGVLEATLERYTDRGQHDEEETDVGLSQSWVGVPSDTRELPPGNLEVGFAHVDVR